MNKFEIIFTLWILLGFWAIFMWYKAFGGFDQKFGVSLMVCIMAMLAAPQCAVAWTLAYLMDRKTKK